MDLKKYFRDNNIKPAQFAKKINISKQLLHWHLKNPHKAWRKDHAEKIVEAIYGEKIQQKIYELRLGEI